MECCTPVKWIAQTGPYRSYPFVVLSGWVDDEISDNPPDCVHAVLKKPIDIETFTNTIEQVLSETSV